MSAAAVAADPREAAERTSLRTRLAGPLAEHGFIVFFAAWVVFLSLFTEYFMTQTNLLILLRQASIFAIVGIGVTMVLLLGELDISFGAVLGLAGVIGAQIAANGAPAAVAVCAAVGVGVGAGLVNGVLVTLVKIPSVVATLGTMGMLGGAALLFTRGSSIIAADGLNVLARGRLAGIPVPVIIMLVLYALAWAWLSRMRFGSHLYAAGDNAEAATRAGISLMPIKLIAFAVAGGLAGFASMIQTSRLGLAEATMGAEFLFPVLTAAILGGIGLTGGRGHVINTMIGAVFLASITNGLILLGVSSTVQELVQGGVLILAVSLDRLRR